MSIIRSHRSTIQHIITTLQFDLWFIPFTHKQCIYVICCGTFQRYTFPYSLYKMDIRATETEVKCEAHDVINIWKCQAIPRRTQTITFTGLWCKLLMRTAAIQDLTAFLMHTKHFLPTLLCSLLFLLIPTVFITCIFARAYLKRLIVLLFQLPFCHCCNHKLLDLHGCVHTELTMIKSNLYSRVCTDTNRKSKTPGRIFPQKIKRRTQEINKYKLIEQCLQK